MLLRVPALCSVVERHRPSARHFPYTTLFRSIVMQPVETAVVRSIAVRMGQQVKAGDLLAHPDGDRAKDRKSTRLNSSHANTSYAVFCLKKKSKLLRMLTNRARAP